MQLLSKIKLKISPVWRESGL